MVNMMITNSFVNSDILDLQYFSVNEAIFTKKVYNLFYNLFLKCTQKKWTLFETSDVFYFQNKSP